MLPSYTLLLLAPFAAKLASATCYGSGDEADKNTVLNDITTKCNMMKGYYEPGLWRAGCTSVDFQNKFWWLEVARTGSDSATLTLQECEDGLKLEIIGCVRGGETTNDKKWRFRYVLYRR